MKQPLNAYRSVLIGILLALAVTVTAQPADSLLLPEQLALMVLQNHPIAKQADLLPAQAAALQQMERGRFDPKAYADWAQKSFDGKNYFRIGEGGLKATTPLGIDLKAAYSVSNGDFLNPEQSLPVAGQGVLGVTVPLLQGLLMDENRAALRQAALQEGLNRARQLEMKNDLLLDALYAYWDWSIRYDQVQVFADQVRVTRERFRGMVGSFEQGYKPAVDTLETFIQLQNQLLQLRQAELELQNAAVQLSNFTWTGDGQRLDALEPFRPVALETGPAPELDAGLLELRLDLQNHPILAQKLAKLDQLEVEQRWAREQFKPRLDLSYQLLGDGMNFAGPAGGTEADPWLNALVTENFKWELSFGFPLFLRKARGKLDLTQIKMLDVERDLQNKQVDLSNKIVAYRNMLQTSRQQIDLYAAMVENYRSLLQAERRKFELGESSVFLLNSREQKLLEARLKLIKEKGNFQKLLNGIYWAAGRLPEVY